MIIFFYQLLVRHGANLSALNKNNETPLDICEDFEMRDRMMTLLTENRNRGGDNRGKVRVLLMDYQ